MIFREKGLRLLSVVAILLAPSVAAAQGEERGEEPDSSAFEFDDWTLDSLDQEDFEAIERDGGNAIVHLSRGILPKPSPGASIEVVVPLLYQNVHDRATGLRTPALVETTEPFDWHDPYECGFFDYLSDDLGTSDLFGGCEERTILQKNSNEPVEDGYPFRELGEIGLRLSYNLPFPMIAQADLRYRKVSSLLFSEDTSRAYLSYDEVMIPFREIGVAHYSSHNVSGAVGVQIPFYGAFVTTEILTIGSYYYLYGGIGADYALVNRLNQYTQIADAKDVIRYNNRQDTNSLIRRNNPEGFRKLRINYEGAIGWRVLGEVITLGIEAWVSVPSESLLQQGEWRAYYAGLRMSLGYLWGTGTAWRQ